MSDEIETNAPTKPEGRQKIFGVSRWDQYASFVLSIFFLFIAAINIVGTPLDWIAWTDAVEIGLLFGILTVVFNMHRKLIDSKDGESVS